MKFFFDASSIYYIVNAEKTQLLIQNGTCSLARYELGNILLTERFLRKKIGEQEQKILLDSITRALNFMKIIGVMKNEQAIIDTAIKYNLSFYDASYVHMAKKLKVVLVTEDEKLTKKVKEYTEVISAKSLA